VQVREWWLEVAVIASITRDEGQGFRWISVSAGGRCRSGSKNTSEAGGVEGSSAFSITAATAVSSSTSTSLSGAIVFDREASAMTRILSSTSDM